MAEGPSVRDLDGVAIAGWVGVGLALGGMAYALGRGRAPLGMAGALVAGVLGAVFGATAESALEGSRRFELDPGSLAGAVAGAVLVLALLARAGGGTSTAGWRDAR